MIGAESKDPEDVCAAHAASGSSLRELPDTVWYEKRCRDPSTPRFRISLAGNVADALRSGWRIDEYSLRSAEKTKKSQPLSISLGLFILSRQNRARRDPAPAQLRLAHARKPAQHIMLPGVPEGALCNQ